MKRLFFLLPLFFSMKALSNDLSQSEKNQACAEARGVVPTHKGTGISQKACLENFSFEVVSQVGGVKQINMIGQTIEDMATVCTVFLVEDPRLEIEVPFPTCSLE